MSTIKSIYEFSVDIEDPATKVKAQAFLAFKKPSRAEREDADSWRAGWVNTYLMQKGLTSEGILLRFYDDKGGIYTEAQKTEMSSIKTRLQEIETARATAQIAHDSATLSTLDVELVTLRERFAQLYRIKESLLQNTAEAKAVQRLVEWLVLYMSYTRPNTSSPWVPFFAGATEEEKYASLDSMDENELYQKGISNLNAVAELFVATGGNLKPEDLVVAEVKAAPDPVAPTASVTPPAADVAVLPNAAP